MSKLRTGTVAMAAAALVAGCAAGPRPLGGGGGHSPTVGGSLPASPLPGPLSRAERGARDLGPVPGSLELTAYLTFRQRNASKLAALLARGGRVSPAQWDVEFGPAGTEVRATIKVLSRAGAHTQWRPGQPYVMATGPAAVMEALFRVRVDYFGGNQRATFYRPLSQPVAPAGARRYISAVTGLNDLPGYVAPAIIGSSGVSPAQISSFYDITPLRRAGIDGWGETVMFPEDAVPAANVLAAYAHKFGLPPFHVTVVTDPAAWGQPLAPASSYFDYYATEAALDLEVVHGLAPGARELVYEPGLPNSEAPAMFAAMVEAHPTAIMSGSFYMNECEQDPGARAAADAEDASFAKGSALGVSIFWASGDRGAYACLNSSTEAQAYGDTLSVNPDGSGPHVTSVGGTTIFLSSTGAYYKEAAWGEPLEQWGGGGGYSTFFSRPSWQMAPGVGNNPGRGVPDVSCDADSLTGWDVFIPTQGQSAPTEAPIGGTSAATPCWSGITALIDEFLAREHLRSVGFAAPTLYYFARQPKGLPAPAFHDITEGDNLHYPATTGWNAATGLGTPDVAHLADDFAWFDRTQLG
ncbi:MAG TPA: S53 family peptidase [Acidimicrobiales bacterium]|nr:S53 family peptidase [Acidimicrobiales bacterium]